MLVEFRIANFRSFREEQYISFLASNKDREMEESHCIDTGVANASKLLRSIAVYGANSSGKSNLILALKIMKKLVLHSDSMTLSGEESISVRLLELGLDSDSTVLSGYRDLYQPFLLDKKSQNMPTRLEIVLLINQIRYQYGFEYDQERICAEWLLVYKSGRPQRWFDYHYNPKTKKNDWRNFSTSFQGDKSGQRELWKANKTEHSLFLTHAVRSNSKLLKPIFAWFEENLRIPRHLSRNNNITRRYMAKRIEKNTQYKKWVTNLMKIADSNICDIQVESSKKKTRYGADENMLNIMLGRTVEGDQKWLNMTLESQGTKRLLGYAEVLFDAMKNGGLLVIDEFDASLHPLLARCLLTIMHNPNLSKGDAQFWITTHDTSLLNPELFRRDQIWFTEKKQNAISEVYSLCEFSPRKNEALEKGYLQGRYGAIPFLSPFLF